DRHGATPSRALPAHADNDQLVDTRLGAPDLARPTVQLAHACCRARQGNRREALRLRVEAHERVRAEVAQPDGVVLVDIDRVWLRARTGKPPLAPAALRR